MATLESRLASLITAIGADVKTLTTGLANAPIYVPFGRGGDLATFTGPRLYFPDNVTLKAATFTLTTAPTGSSANFDILKNGSAVYSSVPSVAASDFLASAGTLSGVTTFTGRTDYLQVQCTQVGSTIPGANLSVVLKLVLT
jgi:hypothetical protein